MEVVQGNSRDKKIIVAQEIAFAKVLAGNNKTLRDRGIRKLRKWLTIRGNGKWEFKEEEFIRIWTGLFYCMWMSDKFLVQEELAESISKLIHCFKKNSDSALLFIKCFHKRILMDWDGLDQYRIDKFQMLNRRFLRQTFVYCKDKDWDETLLNRLMGIFYNVILQREDSFGFILHFIRIYPQELAKIGNGKLDSKLVLKLIEPFVKLLARSDDLRILKETEEFFMFLMLQTDVGIDFDERFNAWKMLGYPGEGPHCLTNVADKPSENDKDSGSEGEDEDLDPESKPLDPRAGSLDVFLPQLELDIEGLLYLFKKHQNSRQSKAKGRRLLRALTLKFQAVSKGRFPVKIKQDPALLEKRKKKRQTEKNAKQLLKFNEEIDEGPIKSEEFKNLILELGGEDEKLDKENEGVQEVEDAAEDLEDLELAQEGEIDECDGKEKEEQFQLNTKKRNKSNKKTLKKIKSDNCINKVGKSEIAKKKNITVNDKKSEQSVDCKQNFEKKKKNKSKKAKREGKSTQQILANMDVVVTPKRKKLLNGTMADSPSGIKRDAEKVTPVLKTGTKRKILSNWQVQELDTSSPEYYKIETPKIITVERKIEETSTLKENEPDVPTVEKEDSEENPSTKAQKEFSPAFWEKAKAKVNRRSGSKSKVFMNPFAKVEEESRTSNRRISFALEKNMAQENEEYLEEVKNSPRVPFDGSKKPVQSVLKSGLAPTPINPFYRFKKIKLQCV